MTPPTARQDRLLATLGERNLGALIVTDLANVRYLTGYVGSNGVALIGVGGRVLLTDSRYAVSGKRIRRVVPPSGVPAIAISSAREATSARP